ncbi:NifB/NifX family molybdenum-iron cluster-binding protein [bacterium]|nr:NifB/NifX family molybdenum-iron cluster-binding protein [bacterium]
MKVAISTLGNDLDSRIDERFGRAKQFLIVDSDSLNFEIIDNDENTELLSGAGIQTAERIVNSGAEIVITGHCGPKAFRTLRAAGIRIVTGAEGGVKEALETLKKGEFQFAQNPNVRGHW